MTFQSFPSLFINMWFQAHLQFVSYYSFSEVKFALLIFILFIYFLLWVISLHLVINVKKNVPAGMCCHFLSSMKIQSIWLWWYIERIHFSINSLICWMPWTEEADVTLVGQICILTWLLIFSFTYICLNSPEGIEALCSDVGVDHTDVRILMLAWYVVFCGHFTGPIIHSDLYPNVYYKCGFLHTLQEDESWKAGLFF